MLCGRKGELLIKHFFGKKHSLLIKFLVPFVLIMIAQNFLFYYTTLLSGTIHRIDGSAFDQMEQVVSSRKSYLAGEMVTRWSSLGSTVSKMNEKMNTLLLQKGSSSQVLADSDLSQQFLAQVSEDVIFLLRKNTVTGAFVVLDTSAPTKGGISRPGIYIRDPDPGTIIADNSDLFIKRGATELHRALRITTDVTWTPRFTFLDSDPNSRLFFENPVQTANLYPTLELSDMGFWSQKFALDVGSEPVITYSLPLIDDQGLVYGVLGVELAEGYLAKLMPYQELSDAGAGVYCLGVTQDGGITYRPMVYSGRVTQMLPSKTANLALTPYPNHESFSLLSYSDGTNIAVSVQDIQLYNSNTPFSNQQWALLGLMDDDDLLSLPASINRTAITTTLLSILVGSFLAYLIFRILIRPIHGLIAQLRGSDPRQPVVLRPVHVAEIDELASAVQELSIMVSDSASMLSRIIEMSDIAIAAFEHDKILGRITFTEQLFPLMGLPNPPIDRRDLSAEEFPTALKQGPLAIEEVLENGWLLRVTADKKLTRWVRLITTDEGSRMLGVAVDATAEVMTKRRIEYERDYDLLTNLLNRRAFLASLDALFEHPETLGNAAMIMLDLDNLKFINDNHGHDSGDGYIQATANALKKTVVLNMLQARMSGDEFFVFLYGYSDKEPLREIIRGMQETIANSYFTLPNAENIRIRCSAGVAWYPDNTTKSDELIRFADFAMYNAKHSKKGDFQEFNQAIYNQNAFLLHSREELNKLIENSLVAYHFQPIVSTATGEIFAYEALMRPTLATLSSPIEVLALAKSQSKLYDIERITWFSALAQAKAQPGFMEGTYRLFINSVSNYILSDRDIAALISAHGDCASRIVLEVTESERFTEDVTAKKRAILYEYGGQIALDDFGTGYNSDSALLLLAPDFVKIDISIVQNIDTDPSRQGIFKNLVSYSKERDIKVIAEGVETFQEMQTLIELGADYLQGYYLGKPAAEFQQLPDDLTDEIRNIYKTHKQKES